MFKRIYRLLLPQERHDGAKVALSVFVSALLNFAGLAALLPILFSLLGKGVGTREALLYCAAAAAFILLKNLIVTLLSRYQKRFLLRLYQRISVSLFNAYYHQGLLYIRNRGSMRLSFEVNFITYSLSLNVLAPLLTIAAELLLVLLITIALLFYEPLMVLLLYALMLPFMLVYSLYVKKRLSAYGEQEQLARRKQARLITEAMNGYTELEINGALPSIIHSLNDGLESISANRLKYDIVGHIPTALSEFAVIVGLAVLAAFAAGDLSAVTGVFALAAFRLLPSIRNIASSWTQAQNSLNCIDTVESGLASLKRESPSDEAEEIPFEGELRAEHISYSYPDGKQVIKDFSCSIAKGSYTGFCGESGVGKSTLFNLLLGFITPDSGSISIDGRALDSATIKAWHKHIGYVPQDVFIFDGTLAENIAPGVSEINRERVERILRYVCLDDWATTLPKGMDTPVLEAGGRLSGGQKQRVGIARALYKGADVLFLDEATSSLDSDTERAINETLLSLSKEYGGLTILLIAHRESTLAYCKDVIRL